MKRTFKKMSLILIMTLAIFAAGFGVTGEKASAANSQTMWFNNGSGGYQMMVWTPHGSYFLPVYMFQFK